MYEPAEDSYLLVEVLKKHFENKNGEKALDVGIGSGIIAKELQKHVEEVHGADIDENVINTLKKEEPNLTLYKSNLFENIPKKNQYDVITFNAPYLPGKRTKEAIDLVGGKEGVEVSNEFLRQATRYLKKDGYIFLVASNHSNLKLLFKTGKEVGFVIEEVSKIHIFFEDIIVYKIQWK